MFLQNILSNTLQDRERNTLNFELIHVVRVTELNENDRHAKIDGGLIAERNAKM